MTDTPIPETSGAPTDTAADHLATLKAIELAATLDGHWQQAATADLVTRVLPLLVEWFVKHLEGRMPKDAELAASIPIALGIATGALLKAVYEDSYTLDAEALQLFGDSFSEALGETLASRQEMAA